MAVQYEQSLFRPRPLQRRIETMTLLRRSGVNFIPFDANGRTIRTNPILEDSTFSWRERYVEAGIIYLTNPLIFAGTNLINDELADGRVVVEEKQGTLWKEHTNNTLTDWIQQPNGSMDIKEFFRAYSTHFHTFGSVSAIMFQPGDILPNGKINDRPNCLDIVFPGRMAEDPASNPYRVEWYYVPIGYEDKEPFRVNPDALFQDVVYNPLAHSLGVSLPNNPLEKILEIHRLYIRQISRFFNHGAVPSHLLTRVIDSTKEATALSITDDEIEEAIQRIYATVGRGARRDGEWLGLRGDWRATRMGSPLTELMNKDLLQYIEALVSSVYGVPSSIFWLGLQASNQRASRQQDSIDFWNRKIKPLQERICQRVGKFLMPKFFTERQAKRFRLWVDTSEMPLAQYANTRQYRMYERWYQMRIIPRGKFLNYVNEPTDDYTQEQLDEFYDGGKGEEQLNVGKGEQDTEDNNGLE